MRSSNKPRCTRRLAGGIFALLAAGGTFVAFLGSVESSTTAEPSTLDTSRQKDLAPVVHAAPRRQSSSMPEVGAAYVSTQIAQPAADAGAVPDLEWTGGDDTALGFRMPEFGSTGVSFGEVASELGKHFPHMDEEAPSAAHAQAFTAYADNMMARLGLNGNREDLETGTLTLFDRLGATPAKLRTQREIVERFVRAFADSVDPGEVARFIDGAPTDQPSSRRWQLGDITLSVSTWPDYGSVELLITGPERESPNDDTSP